jgi:hypothetical protein
MVENRAGDENTAKPGNEPGDTGVQQCVTIFLLPFYMTREDETRISEPGKVKFPRPWEQAHAGRSIWGSNRVTEYFDPSATAVKHSEWIAPDFDLKYDNKESGISAVWRIHPMVTVFVTGFCVLSLKCSPSNPIGLSELLNFNEYFRYTSLMEFQWTQAQKYSYKVHWPSGWDDSKETLEHSGELLKSILPDNHTICLQGFRKMFCCTALSADDVSEADRFRLVTVDAAGSFIPNNEQYIDGSIGYIRCSRWEPEQFLAFTSYSMCWLMNTSVPDFLKPSGEHMPMLYAGVIGQTLVHHTGALAVLSLNLARLDAGDPAFADKVKDLRKQVMTLTNRTWYDRITFEVQGHELYTAWHKALEAQALFGEVQRELQETDNWLSAESNLKTNSFMRNLQVLVAAIGFASVALSVAQLTDGSSLPVRLFIAVIAGLVGALVALLLLPKN